ncbi:mediator complex subunit [Gryganskiella cystojenkinii]|nr:mediator complex subunit [Gryganskiella cystojenkinii]
MTEQQIMDQPNGPIKGLPVPVPVVAPAPTSSRPTAANTVPVTPVLPQNTNGMVPLGAIIHRLSNEAFSDLSNLSEILPSMNDEQRKLHILDYALSKREQFIKLLVLTKWAKSAPKIQQCQNIVGFLHQENELFTRAVGGLFETYKMFGRARVRNFDIPTAIDILTTGTYQRLPSRIKQVYIAEDKPTKTEITSTLERLDDVIRMRLLCDELVPPAMKYTVAKGKAKFVVANEFEVTLTIPGPGSPQEVPWRIVGLRILVKPVGGSFQGLETSLNEVQMKGIIMLAQKELESVPAPNLLTHAAVPVTEVKPANQALLRLYDYLHMLSMQLIIELVHMQGHHLRQSGWTDTLRIDVLQSVRTFVRLVYWNNGGAYTPPSGPQPPGAKRKISPSGPVSASSAKEMPPFPHEHYLEIRIEDYDNSDVKIPEGLAGALVDSKVLGYPKSSIKVVWSQVEKGIVSAEEAASILELDPSNLNIERLLLRAVNMHTGQVMRGFYDRLRSHIDNLKAQPEQQDGARFSRDDIRLETASADEAQTAVTASRSLTNSQTLLVRLKGDRWIRIRIDVRTGRVVVREVGKSGEGDDPVIATFQARLNENASNIVDALVSLRFSMSIVELESMGALLGLQPYWRLALGKTDAAKFGTNIQQILFLQYPQHPRHYLVLGVVDQRFRVWLIEVAPTEREIAGIWLTLKLIVPIYWQGFKRQHSVPDPDVGTKKLISKRKSVQFDIEDEPENPADMDEITIDQDILSKLESLGHVHICHNEAKTQLQEHGIRYHYLTATSLRPSGSDIDGTKARMAAMIPLLRLDPATICDGTSHGLFSYVGAKFTGWWDSERGTCNFVVHAKFAPGVTLPDMESGLLDACVEYFAKTDQLVFTYKTRGSFVAQFRQDWERIVRMLRVTRQLHAPTLSNRHIVLRVCDLHKVQLQYCERYLLTIHWMPAPASDQKSSTGVAITNAPRFKQGYYEIGLSEVDDSSINPHRRMRYFLQDMFNREADLHSLMNNVVQMCPILEVLDRLENTVTEDCLGAKQLSVVPRAAHHIRVIYGSRYALDIKTFSRTHLSMYDAFFPTESFNSDLPPPPLPSTAPALLSTPGRIVPATSRGRLQYGQIGNLKTIIDGIDVDKEDEEFNELQLNSSSMSTTTTTLKEEHPPSNKHSPQTPPATPRDEAEEVYELMPMPNGVLCSRNISGRVLYRLAKHMETLL